MAPITFETAALVAFTLETGIYGLYLSVFAFSMRILLDTRERGKINKLMVGATLAFFLVLTAHFCLSVYRAFTAFITVADEPHGTLVYLATFSDPTYYLTNTLLSISGMIADAILIYRLYIVWDRNFLICVPALLAYIGLVVGGIGLTWFFSIPGNEVFSSSGQKWIALEFSAPLATNIYCTGLIVYRIFISQRNLSHASSNLRNTVQILVESAALYTLVIALNFFCYLGKTNWQFAGLGAQGPIAGLTFGWIIIRVSGHADGSRSKGYASQGSAGRIGTQIQPQQNYPLSPVINIHKTTTKSHQRDSTEGEPMGWIDTTEPDHDRKVAYAV